MKLKTFLLMLLATSLLAPVASASVIFSIVPITLNPTQGSTNDVFEVLLTNSSGSPSISVASFNFGVTSSNPGITFVSAGFATTSAPYIFTGDSFDEDTPLPLNSTSGASLEGGDFTADFTGITVNGGETFGLGQVFYDVSGSATPGPATLEFMTSADANGLSDPDLDSITINSMNGTAINIEGAATPEPSTLLLIPAGLLLLGFWKKTARDSRDLDHL
jgi:hypothetical protein